MRELRVSIPELGFIGGTRGILGAGVGLLLAGMLPAGRRKQVGLGLIAVGVLSTIPIVIGVIKRRAGANGHVRKSTTDERQPIVTG